MSIKDTLKEIFIGGEPKMKDQLREFSDFGDIDCELVPHKEPILPTYPNIDAMNYELKISQLELELARERDLKSHITTMNNYTIIGKELFKRVDCEGEMTLDDYYTLQAVKDDLFSTLFLIDSALFENYDSSDDVNIQDALVEIVSMCEYTNMELKEAKGKTKEAQLALDAMFQDRELLKTKIKDIDQDLTHHKNVVKELEREALKDKVYRDSLQQESNELRKEVEELRIYKELVDKYIPYMKDVD